LSDFSTAGNEHFSNVDLSIFYSDKRLAVSQSDVAKTGFCGKETFKIPYPRIDIKRPVNRIIPEVNP